MPQKGQKKLEAEGWERMTTTDEPRLSELAEEYGELGFEVHIEPFHPGEERGCAKCMEEEPEKYRTIYVRKRSNKQGRPDRPARQSEAPPRP